MSIVGPNGKSVPSGERETVKYIVGNVSLETDARPSDRLQHALEGTRQMAQMQIVAAAKQKAASAGIHVPEESIRVQAMAEASKITDPFQMEPCAQAVFMLLAIEISQRDEIIKKLSDRIEKLECSSKQKEESSSEDGSQLD